MKIAKKARDEVGRRIFDIQFLKAPCQQGGPVAVERAQALEVSGRVLWSPHRMRWKVTAMRGTASHLLT